MNKQTILISTKNQGKLKEIKNFLSDLSVNLVSLSDIGIKEEVEEDGKTYEENSKKKALFYSKKSGLPTIADDGGIEIDALGGGPGIRSKRFFGKNGKDATDEEIIEKMIKISSNLPKNKKGAKFIALITLALPDGRTWSVRGEVLGIISEKPYMKLLHGYPYRSFFYLPEIKKYYHENELTNEEQKSYNHRWKAIEKLKPIILRVILK